MSSHAISSTDWTPGKWGYDHFRKVEYFWEKTDGALLAIYSGVADTSSTKEIDHDGKKIRVCRLYQDKSNFDGWMPSDALQLSAISGALTPLYALGRIVTILSSPLYGFKEKMSRCWEMMGLQIKYFFAHLMTILESLLVSSDPMNGRGVVEGLEQQMNRNSDGTKVGLEHSIWITQGRMKHFPKDSAWKGGFYWQGCYQTNAMGILNDNNDVIGVLTFGGERGTGKPEEVWINGKITMITTQFRVIKCQPFEAYPWTRAIQWMIRRLTTSTPRDSQGAPAQS